MTENALVIEGTLEIRDGSAYDGFYTAYLDPTTEIVSCNGAGPSFDPNFMVHLKGCSLAGVGANDASGRSLPIWYGAVSHEGNGPGRASSDDSHYQEREVHQAVLGSA